jgi:hypothetical protein
MTIFIAIKARPSLIKAAIDPIGQELRPFILKKARFHFVCILASLFYKQLPSNLMILLITIKISDKFDNG